MQSGDGGAAAAEGFAGLVSAVLDRPVVRGAQSPRILVVPDGTDHPLWSEVEDFVGRLGVELDEWQWLILRVALRRTGDLWAAFTVAVVASRQNGKNGVMEIRELIGPTLLGEHLVIHTAHLADTSKEAFRRLDDLIDANEWLSRDVKHIWRTNGHEAIEFRNGNRIRFRTRTRGGGRGFSGSPIMLDEAMELPEVSMGSILPVASAQPDPQLWYMGSAVDQSVHMEGVAFARVRERALEGDHKRLAYFEWSLPFESPADLEERDLADHDNWAAANPAFGIRIQADYVEAERRELADRTFAVERLGVGDWPPTDGSGSQVIPLERWDALEDDPSSPGARMLDPVALAVDTTPGREMTSIMAAGAREDGQAQVEVLRHDPGTGWVADALDGYVSRHSPLGVWVGMGSPAASLIPELVARGIPVEPIAETDHAKACGHMFDSVTQGTVRHLGGQVLRNAVKGATKRPMGDAWAWSRRNSAVDISPLVGGTFALWGWFTTGNYGAQFF